MKKTKKIALTVMSAILILLFLGNWVIPVRANNTNINTPTPTGTPIPVMDTLEEVLSAEEQESLKAVIRAYIDIHYQMLSVLSTEDYQQYDLNGLISKTPEAEAFLREEMSKLALEIKRADVYQLRYMDYKYALDFRNITIDPNTQTVTVLVIEGNEVTYEISAKLNSEAPIVSHTAGIEHKILLQKIRGQWKIISDTYDDDLWKILHRAGKSTEDIIRASDNMIRILEASSKLSTDKASHSKILPTYNIANDPSTHPYDRDGAVEYALQYWNNYNLNYWTYGNDCQNFVSQAIYEGGNASMYIPEGPLPPPSDTGQIGWYYLNNFQRATAWNDVNSFYDYVSILSSDLYGEGPEGVVLATLRAENDDLINDVPVGVMPGDVIQYEWLATPEEPDPNGSFYDHSAIVVAVEGGLPYVAAHTNDHDMIPYTLLTPIEEVRFIHIEQSNGYPPVKVDITSGVSDAGMNPQTNCLDSYTDGNIYLGSCFNNGGSVVSGFQFTDVPIPSGATIKYAYITFTVDGPYDTNGANPGAFKAPISLNIFGDRSTSDFSSAFPSTRTELTTPIPWDITGAVNGPVYDYWIWKQKRTTPNLSNIVQDLVNSSWNYRQSLNFIFKNNGAAITDGLGVRRVLAFERTDVDSPTADVKGGYWPARLIAAYSFGGGGGTGSTAPTVYSVTRSSESPTNASEVEFTVKFSENVTGVDAADFSPAFDDTLSEVFVTGTSGSGDTYTVTVATGDGDGKIRLDVITYSIYAEDDSQPLNGGFTNGEAYEIDKTAPTVLAITRISGSPTDSTTVSFLVSFSEYVKNVDSNDFIITKSSGIDNANILSANQIPYSPKEYIVTVDTGMGSGTIRLDALEGATIIDRASNSVQGGYINGEVYTIEKTPIVAAIALASTNPTSAGNVDFLVTFSETVTGVDTDDFTVITQNLTGASISAVQGTDKTYTVTVDTGNGDGTLWLKVLSNSTIVSGNLLPMNGEFTGAEGYTIDKSAPSVVSISRASDNPSDAQSVDFTVMFSESVIGVDIGDFALITDVSDASISAVQGAGKTYIVTVNTGSGDGALGLGILDNGSIVDITSNPLVAGFTNGETYSVYKLPTVTSVERASANPTSAVSVDFIVTFSKPVTGVDAGDFALTTAGPSSTAISAVNGSGSSYTVTIATGVGDGTIRLDVHANGTIIDAASHSLMAAFTDGEYYTIDRAPRYTTLTCASGPTNTSSVEFTAIFSESVTGVDISDFLLADVDEGLTDLAITSVNGSGNTYSITVTGNGSGSFSMIGLDNDSIQDGAANPLGGPGIGNGETNSDVVCTIDRIAPIVSSIVRANNNPTKSSTVDFIVAFSEDVSSVDLSDFALTTNGVSGAEVVAVDNYLYAEDIYLVSVSTGSGDGTIRLDVVNSTIVDGVENPLSSDFTTGEVYTVDKTTPAVSSITRTSTNPTNAASVLYTVIFSEPVTGVSTNDFTLSTTGISGASVTGVSGTGDSYTVTVNTGSGSGTLQLVIPTGATITDLAGNAPSNLPFAGDIYTIDKTAPTVVSITRASINPTNAASVNYTVTFSESVTGVAANDFSLTTSGLSGTSVTSVSGSGNNYTVTVSTGSGSGTLKLIVPVTATINDLAGNAPSNLPFAGETYTIDKTAPTVASINREAPPAYATLASAVTFKVTFSEPVTGVDMTGPTYNDFSLTTGLAGASVTSVAGSGTTYTVTVNTGTGGNTLRLNLVDQDTILDSAGNKLGGAGSGNGNFTSGQIYNVRKATFTDVSTTHWAWEFIERVAYANVTGGCTATTYCPETYVTRAQLAVFLLRGKYGSAYYPPPVGSSTGYNDVATTYWAAAWIKQLTVEGVTSGCGNGNYCPESNVTRDQVAVFLLRTKYGAGYTPPAVGSSSGFNDVPTTHWAAAWIKQLVAEGLGSGCGGGNYCPTSLVTRAQMAEFLVKTFNLP